jgi:hypothetical protein
MVYNHRGREVRHIRLEVRLSEEENDLLNTLCRLLDKTASAVVRSALNHYLSKLNGGQETDGLDRVIEPGILGVPNEEQAEVPDSRDGQAMGQPHQGGGS